METTRGPSLLTGKTLFRVGLALVILSVTFLLRYSIEQGWFGPLARVGLAGTAGALMIGVGLTLGRSRRLYANLLQGGGSAILYLTAFAAHRQYRLIDTSEALIQLAAVSAVAVGLAVYSRSELLAGIGLFGAGAAPLVLAGRMAIQGGDGPYLAMVGLAAGVLLFRMRWVLSYAAAAATIGAATFMAVFAPRVEELLGASSPAPDSFEIAFSMALAWIVLVIVPLTAAFMPPLGASASLALPSVTTAFGSPLVYLGLRFGFGEALAQLEWAAIALAGALFHVAIGLGLQKRSLGTVARVQLVPALILLITATATALSGSWILVGLAAIASGAVLGGRRSGLATLTDVGHAGLALAFIATVITTVETSTVARTLSEIAPGALVLAIIAITGFVLHVERSESPDVEAVYHLVAYVGTLGWMLIEFPRLGESGLALVTAGWAALGLASVTIGKLHASRMALGVGFTTLGLALAKLFLVDLAEAPPITRIALFAGIGLALLVIGYWLDEGPALETENPAEASAQGPYTTESI